MAKLVKVYDTAKDMDILINIDSISVVDLMHRDVILNNCSQGFRIISVDNKSIKDIYEACGYKESEDLHDVKWRTKDILWSNECPLKTGYTESEDKNE